MSLRWEKLSEHGLVGYSGSVSIALVGRRRDGPWVWQIDGVYMKWVATGRGERKTQAAAKKAAERAWSKWLVAAGLQANPERSPDENAAWFSQRYEDVQQQFKGQKP